MKKFYDRINKFIPLSAAANEELYRQHQFFVVASFITSLFALGYFFMSVYIKGTGFAIAMICSSVIFFILPFLLRRGFKLKLLANILLGIIAVVYCLLVYWEGGIRMANVAPWIILLPALALLKQGRKAAVVWLFIAIIIITFFSYFTFRGIKFSVLFDPDKDPVFSVLSLSGILFITYLIVAVFEGGKNEAVGKLEAQKEVLEKLNTEKNNFIRFIAHDLTNPLASIRNFAEAAANRLAAPEKKQLYLDNILVATDRMYELIKNLLDMNLIEQGKLSLERTSVNLNQLIFQYCNLAKSDALSKEIELLCELPEANVFARTDKARIEQILDNYVSNAMKYCPANTKVTVKLTDSSGYSEIAVSDEGPGIDTADQALLFHIYSVTAAMPRNGETKSGLGLAIVKRISDALGLQYGCRSEIGKGSEFFIRFPKD